MDSKGTSRLLLSLLLFSSLIFPTTFSRSLSSTPPNPVSDKVSVELYYETLCPDSVDFILNHLVKLFHTGLISIVDLKLLPYGNAKLRSNSTIICQVNSISKSKSGCLFILCKYLIYTLFTTAVMAFSRRAISQSLVLSCLVLFSSFCPSPTWASESRKVSLELYYESLCPYSANFIVNYLVKLFEDDLISIVDLNLVPWGNAKIRGNNNTVVCQVRLFIPPTHFPLHFLS